MTDVNLAGQTHKKCDLCVMFYCCLRCGELKQDTKGCEYEPKKCHKCGYFGFKPEYHFCFLNSLKSNRLKFGVVSSNTPIKISSETAYAKWGFYL